MPRKPKNAPKVVTPALIALPEDDLPLPAPLPPTAEPVERTPELCAEVIEWISSGRNLSDWCRLPGRPHRRTVQRWAQDDPAFGAAFRAARRDGIDTLAEHGLRLALGAIEKDKNGKVDMGEVARRKMAIWGITTLLARWDPTRYGEKLTVAGDADNPVKVEHSLSPEERAARIEQLLDNARKRRLGAAAAAAKPARPIITVESASVPDPGARLRAFLSAAQARFKPRIAPGAHDRVAISASPADFIVAWRAGDEVLRISRERQSARFLDRLLPTTGGAPIVVDVDARRVLELLAELQRRGVPCAAANGARELQRLVDNNREVALPPGDHDDAVLQACAAALSTSVQITHIAPTFDYMLT